MSFWNKLRKPLIAAGAVAGSIAMPALAPALISGAASVYSTDKSIKASKEAVAAQNAYNSPAAQMQRLQAAGLNPNLVYGSGNVVGNQSGTYSSDYSGYGKAVDNALNTYMAIDNHDMEMQMKAEQILAAQKNNKWIDVNNALQISKTLMEDKILNAQLRIDEARARMIEHDAAIADRYPSVYSGKNYLTLPGIADMIGSVGNKYFPKIFSGKYN